MNDDQDWVVNYFNYFTEMEEHFQRARGTGLFLLSPLDWALIESWKNCGVPLEAVLRGIDAAFEKWRSAEVQASADGQFLAFCAQAVHDRGAGHGGHHRAPVRSATSAPPFSPKSCAPIWRATRAAVREAGFEEIAAALERLAGEAETHIADLEALEQRLTVLEEKMIALARTRQSEEAGVRGPPRAGRATAALPRQDDAPTSSPCWRSSTWSGTCSKRAGLPRLSLFYMR